MRKPENDFAQLIKGDWLGQKTNGGFEHGQMEFLMFEDSVCQMPYDHDGHWYEILEDTLYIRSMKGQRIPPAIFTIAKLTKDSLVLLSGKQPQDTTRYYKSPIKNNITPGAIYFARVGCFDDCPMTYVEIDSNRNIRSCRESYTSKIEGYKGKLNETEYNSIISKIRALPVDSLKEYYPTSHEGDETLGVVIAYGNKEIRSAIYGHEVEPMELYILLTYLANLEKWIILQPDSSVKKENFVSNTQQKPLNNLLVPPPPKITNFTPPKVED
jgi:hypothetical protein